jgi:geranylgeranylglycerol-phosphate geranylgeranyltransferase
MITHTAIAPSRTDATTGAMHVAARRRRGFLAVYVRSMRPYYSFVTGIAGWIGVAYARSRDPESATPARAAVALVVLFLAWGVNQIVNDYLGLREDRINAPRRPMVTGELDSTRALALSFALMAAGAATTAAIAPWALVPLAVGTLLNVVYEYAKGVPVLGNVVFGVMIAMCTVYGFLATAPSSGSVLAPVFASVLLVVAVTNGLMTYYTYFKDHDGDRAAGKITAVVLMGIERSRRIALRLTLLPAAVTVAAIALGAIGREAVGPTFLVLLALGLVLQIRTGWLYYRHPTGREAYTSLATNFRACTCGQAALIALFDPALATCLFVVAFVLVGLLFALERDHLA